MRFASSGPFQTFFPSSDRRSAKPSWPDQEISQKMQSEQRKQGKALPMFASSTAICMLQRTWTNMEIFGRGVVEWGRSVTPNTYINIQYSGWCIIILSVTYFYFLCEQL